jgi:hypothetical protein
VVKSVRRVVGRKYVAASVHIWDAFAAAVVAFGATSRQVLVSEKSREKTYKN